jgi:hypothetical protein
MAVDFALHTHERDCCGSGEAGAGQIKISDCDLYSGLPRLPPDPVMSFRPLAQPVTRSIRRSLAVSSREQATVRFRMVGETALKGE